MMRIAALIIGIDGWAQYTLPLVQSLHKHEFDADVVVIDNASETPYPPLDYVHRTERLSYAQAINRAQEFADDADWYIVLSNDVLCTGEFDNMLNALPDDCIAGPHIAENHGVRYLEGWCVCVPQRVWDALGGWDENYIVSSWEDVDFSMNALKAGYRLCHVPDLPFVHLDQQQRFTLIPDYWQSERHNLDYFMRKHAPEQVAG